MRDCTADSLTRFDFEIYDIALSPSGKLYLVTDHGLFYAMNTSTLAVQQIGSGLSAINSPNALVCDSFGNLITIGVGPGSQGHVGLFYVDTLTLATSFICPIDFEAAGDLTYYQGDIYYDDEGDTLHRVTLNPAHDYTLGPLACSNGGSFGLSTNIIDTVNCEPTIFAYSNRSICTVNPANGNATLLCPDIINGNAQFTGAASVYGLSCHSALQAFVVPNAFTPNGDGLNDKFFPVLVNGVKDTEFRIYNRWGQCVHNAPQPWDGTFNEVAQPVGTYLYYVVLTEDNGTGQPKEIKQQGAVTLLR